MRLLLQLVKELDETTRGEGGFGSTNVGVDKGIDKAKQVRFA